MSTKLSPAVAAAIKLSATIENSGQCTALRHAVVQCSESDVANLLSDVAVVSSPQDALKKGEFAGVFDFAGNVVGVNCVCQDVTSNRITIDSQEVLR